MRPRLLDLFAGAGGAARGYQLAGFHVTGIDHVEQPNYCGDEFVQADALEFLTPLNEAMGDFEAIHASPPCQAYTHARHIGNRGRSDHPRLVEETRELLIETGLPYIIENVPGAPLLNPVMLCGGAFGLDVERHRLFETNFPVMSGGCAYGVHRPGRFPGTPRADGSKPDSRVANSMASGISHEVFARAMGIDWMPARGFRPTNELREAIPPAYTEHIGHYLLKAVRQPVPAQALSEKEGG